MHDFIAQFTNAIRAAGLSTPDSIEADGKLHRFSSNGKRGDNAGWYLLHEGRIPAGAFGDWRTSVWETWRVDLGRQLTTAERIAYRVRVEAMRRQREAEEARRHAEARERAAVIWKAAQPVADHPYLKRKSIRAHGIRVHHGALVIAMRDTEGLMHSLQFIGPNGEKRFLTGGRKKGCYFGVGKPNGTLCIAEGYATAASVHEATGHAVAVAFDAGNLMTVARALRIKLPEVRIVICADNDIKAEV